MPEAGEEQTRFFVYTIEKYGFRRKVAARERHSTR